VALELNCNHGAKSIMMTHITRTEKADPCHPLPLSLSDLSAAIQFLSPAAVLPEQFYCLIGRTSAVRGEVALMRAVLAGAIVCLQQQTDESSYRARRLAAEAEQWFMADDTRWPFSFVNICSVLGLDAEYLRRGLRRWRLGPHACPTAGRLLQGAPHRHLRTAA
jgi:hypothetical protein